jgi:hypothetical protein
MPQKNSSITELLKDRGSSYGQTWIEAGKVLQLLHVPFTNFVGEAGWMAHNWVLILSKLIRILYTPYNEDHWRDLIGYATLILDHLTRTDQDDVSSK